MFICTQRVNIWSSHSIKFEIQAGKEGGVDFSTGQEPMIYKGKNGHLMVVSDYFHVSA